MKPFRAVATVVIAVIVLTSPWFTSVLKATLPGCDNFNRGTAADLDSTDWTTQVAGFYLDTNTATSAFTNGFFSYSYWGADSFANDQVAEANLGNNVAASHSVTGITVRASGTGGSMNAYLFECTATDGYFVKIIAGSASVIGSAVTNACTSHYGELFRLEIVSNTLEVFRGGSSLGTQASGGELTSGSPGMGINPGSAAALIDNWKGYDYGGSSTCAAGSRPPGGVSLRGVAMVLFAPFRLAYE